ncbi:hypothetical protein Cadr_000027534 [Camelus dromedarius]|uniref:Uncharacterized protein n=1 Tax=Camelus dromedarius TaxID=9838 RepID=A0A5N4CBP8_CAMDR|nr:hypothetical protein Cadr_000027534 [Camelus dromedarius]
MQSDPEQHAYVSKTVRGFKSHTSHRGAVLAGPDSVTPDTSSQIAHFTACPPRPQRAQDTITLVRLLQQLPHWPRIPLVISRPPPQAARMLPEVPLTSRPLQLQGPGAGPHSALLIHPGCTVLPPGWPETNAQLPAYPESDRMVSSCFSQEKSKETQTSNKREF